VKHSEADRFTVDAQGDVEVESVEVYVIATDEDRGPVSISWRHLGLAIAALATIAAVLIASLPSGGGHSRSPPTSATSCVGAVGYGGLGGRASAFAANNNGSTGPAGPTPGSAWYTVTATARGCVSSFSVQDAASPPLTARELLTLVSDPYLPRDAEQLVETGSCAVWESAVLQRATGSAYARASAIAQAGSIPGSARIEVTSNRNC